MVQTKGVLSDEQKSQVLALGDSSDNDESDNQALDAQIMEREAD